MRYQSSCEESAAMGWGGAEQDGRQGGRKSSGRVQEWRVQGKDSGEDRVSISGPQLLQPRAE